MVACTCSTAQLNLVGCDCAASRQPFVFVRDDLVQVGLTEDGDADIARAFYLVVQFDDGARFAHDHVVTAHRGAADAATVTMNALKRKVQVHLDNGGKLHSDHWGEVDPAYGSTAYQRLDSIGYFWAGEVLAADVAGEAVPRELVSEALFIQSVA